MNNQLKIKIKGNVPLIKENSEDYFKLFDPEYFNNEYVLQPEFEILSEVYEGSKYKNLDDSYLTGLVVIAKDWVSLGFVGFLLNSYGLVLTEAHPFIINEHRIAQPYVKLHFKHIYINTRFEE